MEPTGRAAVENVAVCSRRRNAPGVRSVLVVVSTKSTPPVGVPEPGAVAVDLGREGHGWPTMAVLVDTVTMAVDAGLLHVLGEGSRLNAKVPFPCIPRWKSHDVPTASARSVTVATPSVRATVPSIGARCVIDEDDRSRRQAIRRVRRAHGRRESHRLAKTANLTN